MCYYCAFDKRNQTLKRDDFSIVVVCINHCDWLFQSYSAFDVINVMRNPHNSEDVLFDLSSDWNILRLMLIGYQ